MTNRGLARAKGAIPMVAASVVLLAAASQSPAVEIVMDTNCAPPAALGTAPNTISATGSGTAGAPYLYTFTASDGLNMKPGATAYDILTAVNNISFMLDLNNGSIAGGGNLRSIGTATPSSGAITVTNVGAATLNSVMTCPNPGLSPVSAGAVRLAGNGTGKLTAGSIQTYVHRDGAGGPVTISGFTEVELTASATVQDYNGNWHTGSVLAFTYYTADSPAVSISDIGSGGVSLKGVDLRTYGAKGGNLTISSNVAGPVRITGPIDLGGAAGGGTLNISHAGLFAAEHIKTFTAGNGAVGAISIHGDGTGAFSAATVQDFAPRNGYGTAGISISGYTGVELTGSATVTDWEGIVRTGTILCFNDWDASSPPVSITNIGGAGIKVSGDVHTRAKNANVGGNVVLSASGPIVIGGELNLDGPGGDGAASLVSTASSITLNTLDMAKVGWAGMEFGMTCIVTGAVVNFATNYTGGSGAPLDPYLTAQTGLRTPAGKKIMYFPEVSSNAYLQAASWRLASLAGAAGQGGVLTPYQARGTVVFFR